MYIAKNKIITAEKVYMAGEQVPAEIINKYKHLKAFVDGTAKNVGVEIQETAADTPAAGTTAAGTTAADTPDTDQIFVDDKEDISGGWLVNVGGIKFEVNQNQVRDDGSLTDGGIKKYNEAKQQQEQ